MENKKLALKWDSKVVCVQLVKPQFRETDKLLMKLISSLIINKRDLN